MRKISRILAIRSNYIQAYKICTNAARELRFRLGTMRHARSLHAEIDQLRKHNAALKQQAGEPDLWSGSINPANIVWIFGTGRSGSSWLWRMLVSQEGRIGWNEPYVGVMFPPLEAATNLRKREETIFGDSHRQAWKDSLKEMFLRCAVSRFPNMELEDYLIVKEPNGSAGASWLTEAIPESRLIVLARDPRDVVASALDSVKPGAWRHYSNESTMTLEQLTKRRAETYRDQLSASLAAYEEHKGLKSIISYEELSDDALHHVKRLHRELNLPITADTENAINEHAWANVPDRRKGEGRAMRKATPGSWHEDLNENQIRIIEEINSTLMARLEYSKVT